MEFRRSGPLDERRRRVLMDEIASPHDENSSESALPAGNAAKGPVRAYNPAVLSHLQPQVTDFVPVRIWVVLLIGVLALAGVGAVEFAHVYTATRISAEEFGNLQALDIGQRGSLAAWYSSALLAVAAAWSLVIYGVRVHRVDDYRGRYRIWLWTAAGLAWLSIDAATGLHDGLGLLLARLGGNPLRAVAGDAITATNSLTWIGLYGLVFGPLAIRLGMEIWQSLLCFAIFMLSVVLYVGSGLMHVDWLVITDPMRASVVESSAALLAHLALAAAVGLYARHVYLDAEGRLKVFIDPDKKKPKPKNRAKLKVVKDEKTENQSLDHPAMAASAAKPSHSSSEDDDSEEDDDSYGDQRLSKSERRRLKKLARREAQRRAA
jgi:hypothetical protein